MNNEMTIIIARPAPRGVVSLPHMIYKIPNHISLTNIQAAADWLTSLVNSFQSQPGSSHEIPTHIYLPLIRSI